MKMIFKISFPILIPSVNKARLCFIFTTYFLKCVLLQVTIWLLSLLLLLYQCKQQCMNHITVSIQSCVLTLIADEVVQRRPGLVVAEEGGVGGHAVVEAVFRVADTFLPQVPHEQLQADEGEDAQAEHGEDHHVRQLLHRLDQSAHDRLQACRHPEGAHEVKGQGNVMWM